MTINERLAKLKALCDAATPGPWEIDPNDAGDMFSVCSAEPNHTSPGITHPYQTCSLLAGDGWHGASHTFAHPDDARFIASARNTQPALIAALEEIRTYLCNRFLAREMPELTTIIDRIIERHLGGCNEAK